jgi:hypothetical protein
MTCKLPAKRPAAFRAALVVIKAWSLANPSAPVYPPSNLQPLVSLCA